MGNKFPGRSLIEMIVLLGIFTMIAGSLYLFVRSTWSLNTFVSESLIGQQDVLKVLKTFTSETRSSSLSNLGAYPVVQAATGSFMFYSDIGNDGLYDRVRYYMSGTTLKKGVLTPSGNPLAYNPASEKVSNIIQNVINGTSTPVFTFYGSGYDGAATSVPLVSPVDLLALRLVKLYVLIDRTLGTAPGVLTFTTQVSLRHLKDNL